MSLIDQRMLCRLSSRPDAFLAHALQIIRSGNDCKLVGRARSMTLNKSMAVGSAGYPG
jgi:hypothetical protein